MNLLGVPIEYWEWLFATLILFLFIQYLIKKIKKKKF